MKTHGVRENDNGAIDAVARQFATIADEANCAIELLHHVRKASTAGVTVDDGRGAGSLNDAARAVRVSEEAVAAQVKPEERKRYFRADSGKANMAPPAESATWFKLQSINLDNGPEPGFGGDFVGVVTSWKLPGVFAGVSVAIPAPLRVWYWNGEDPQEETERRIGAILLHFKIDPDAIGGRLFIDNGLATCARLSKSLRPMSWPCGNQPKERAD